MKTDNRIIVQGEVGKEVDKVGNKTRQVIRGASNRCRARRKGWRAKRAIKVVGAQRKGVKWLGKDSGEKKAQSFLTGTVTGV
jgi:hypothetical protein